MLRCSGALIGDEPLRGSATACRISQNAASWRNALQDRAAVVFTAPESCVISFLYYESHSGMRNNLDQATGAKFVGAVESAVTVLRFLAHAAAPAGVASIARETGLNVSTTFNILRTLAKEGLVAFETATKTYSIALGVLEFSAPLLGTNQVDLIHPELERLSTEHSSLIGLWKIAPNDRIVLVDRVADINVVRVDMAIGTRLPAFIGAVGRCIAATRDLSAKELEARFRRLRWQAPPRFEDYAADVAAAGKRGYAFDYGQLFKGVDIVASVIRDHAGEARFGISGIVIAGQLSRPALAALGQDICKTTDHISANLYGRALESIRQKETRPAARPAKGRAGKA
jgi:DNA-binding IclR family transcriptional regulator